MKLFTALIMLVLAAVGGAVLFKRLAGSAELPLVAAEDGVPLTPVPTFQEAP